MSHKNGRYFGGSPSPVPLNLGPMGELQGAREHPEVLYKVIGCVHMYFSRKRVPRFPELLRMVCNPKIFQTTGTVCLLPMAGSRFGHELLRAPGKRSVFSPWGVWSLGKFFLCPSAQLRPAGTDCPQWRLSSTSPRNCCWAGPSRVSPALLNSLQGVLVPSALGEKPGSRPGVYYRYHMVSSP